VLKLLRTGLSNKLIARELGMTEATVKVHVRHAMRKLGASNRTEAAIIATGLRLEMANGAPASKAEQLPVSHEIGQSHRISVMVYGRVCENRKNTTAHGDWRLGGAWWNGIDAN
jgi:predicted transcriptional regulator